MTKTTKIVYNACYGGFGLSDKAFEALLDKKGVPWEVYSKEFGFTQYRNTDTGDIIWSSSYEEDRSDKDLVSVVEEFGAKANGMCARLKIKEVPKGWTYRIDEYDGYESVNTRDDYEWSVA
jgi:hypothetical protein